VDIESRLNNDIEVFAKEVEQLDCAGALARALKALGLSAPGSGPTASSTRGADRSQRPAPRGEPDRPS
jgi:hypothetical protein